MCVAMTSRVAIVAMVLAACCIIAESFPRKQSGPTCQSYSCTAGRECYMTESNAPACRPSCQVIRCGNGDVCRDGQCVPDKCSYVRCRSGTTCVDGECVSDEVDQCASVLCETGTTCVNGVCNPIPRTCDDISCPAGQVCYLQQVQCFVAPCYPIPTCTDIKCPCY